MMCCCDQQGKRERLARRLYAAVMAEHFELASADDVYLSLLNEKIGSAWLQLADDALEREIALYMRNEGSGI
jgi:hypothetical protein